jgi:hypothetical protein
MFPWWMIVLLLLSISIYPAECFSARTFSPSWTLKTLSPRSCTDQWYSTHRTLLLLDTSQHGESAADNDNDGDDSDDYDEEDEGKTAYGNRSLFWTNNYRKLLPYEHARHTAMQLGLRSKEEWDDSLADGEFHHGPYLPSRPDEMYADDWVSWEEFLGICRTYEESRELVITVLKFSSMEDYTAFIEADSRRAAGLRIPYKPEIIYRDTGWISEQHFLGINSGISDL